MKKYAFLLALVAFTSIGMNKAWSFGAAQPAGITMHLPQLENVAQADPSPVPSPLVEPQSPSDVLGELSPIVQAVKAHNWVMLAALMLMLLVYGVRHLFANSLSPQALPIVSALLGCIVAIASGLAAGVGVWSAISGGLLMGSAASGLWSLVFQWILPVPKSQA